MRFISGLPREMLSLFILCLLSRALINCCEPSCKGEALKGFTQMLQRQFSSDYKELRFKRSLLSNYQMQLPAAPVCQWISAISILESNLESESAHCPSSRWLMTERRRHRVNYGICIHKPKNCKQLWTDRSLTSSASFFSWDKHQNGANNK